MQEIAAATQEMCFRMGDLNENIDFQNDDLKSSKYYLGFVFIIWATEIYFPTILLLLI
jgi:hypothetical protein